MSPRTDPTVIDNDTGEVVVELERNPLNPNAIWTTAPEGASIAEIIGDTNLPWQVHINGQFVPKERWKYVRPKKGTTIQIDLPPGGKSFLRIILMIVVVVVSIWAPYASGAAGALSGSISGLSEAAAGSIIGAGISMVGMLAVNAIVPPPTPSLSGVGGGDTFGQLDSITRFSNQVDKFGAINQVFGERSFFPKIVGSPYSEYVDDIQYAYVLLMLGYGPLTVTKKVIQETTFEDFNKDEELIKWEIGESPALYSKDHKTANVQSRMDEDSDVHTATTDDETDRITISLVGDQLYCIDDDGDAAQAWVSYLVEYQEVGDSGWKNAVLAADPEYSSDSIFNKIDDPISYNLVPTTVRGRLLYYAGSRGDHPVYAKKRVIMRVPVYAEPGQEDTKLYLQNNYTLDPVRASYSWRVPTGKYNVRIKRISHGSKGGDHQKTFKTAWTTIASIRDESPVDIPGTVLMAVRIKASGSLNGIIDQIKVTCKSHLRTFDGEKWTDPVETNNPAWGYAHALAGKPASRPISYDSLNGPALKAWAKTCEDNEWTMSSVADTEISSFKLAKDIAACAFASWSLDRTGYYSVIRDFMDNPAKQTFTPRNTWNFSASRAIAKVVEGLRIQFKNKEKDWADDEVYVYNTGFDETTAQEYETLQLSFVESEKHAKLLGLYHLAVAQLRPETYVFKTNATVLRLGRGDCIRVQHDVPLWGSGSGRVIHTVEDGSHRLKSFTLDDTATLYGDEDLVARVTHVMNGVTEVVDLNNPGSGRQSEFTLKTAGDIDMGVDDIVAIGKRNHETAKLKITKIEFFGSQFDAKITAVDAAPEIADVFDGTIPVRDPNITIPPPPQKIPPSPPFIVDVTSNESVAIRNDDGSLQFRVKVEVSPGPGKTETDRIYVSIRKVTIDNNNEKVTGRWITVLADHGAAYFTSVVPGDNYDIRAWAVGTNGILSEYTYRRSYTVLGRQPQKPTNVQVERGTFDVTLTPEGPPPSASYEYWQSGTSLTPEQITVLGSKRGQGSGSYTITRLSPDTEYYFYVRTVNYYGVSDFYGLQVKTKNEPADIIKVLQNQISKDELTQDLSDQIDHLENLELDGLDGINDKLGTLLSDRLSDIELTFDTNPPGTTMLPTGWRGGNKHTGYLEPLDDSYASYGKTDTDAGDWYTAKCYRVMDDMATFSGSVQADVEDGKALVVVRFYRADAVFLGEKRTAPITSSGKINYSFPVYEKTGYIELILVAVDDLDFVDDIPLWFDDYDPQVPIKYASQGSGDGDPIEVYS